MTSTPTDPALMSACAAFADTQADERITGHVVFLIAGALDIVWEPGAAVPLRGVIDDVVEAAAARLAGTDPELAIPSALVTMSRRMDAGGVAHRGLDGLAALLDAIPTWTDATALDLARKIAESIDDPRFGGALARRWFRDGLRDAAKIVPTLEHTQLAVSMTRVGDTWQTLARHLRDDVADGVVDLEQTGRYALSVQTFEETFHARVLDVFGEDSLD